MAFVVHVAEIVLRIGVALRCSSPNSRLAWARSGGPLAADVHVAEITLRLGVALRCSEPKLRLASVESGSPSNRST